MLCCGHPLPFPIIKIIFSFPSCKITGGITEISFARSNALLASSALAQNSLNNGRFYHEGNLVCVSNCKLIFNWKFLITGLSWYSFDVIWDFNWGAWRRSITDSHLVVSRVLQISCRDELQWGADILWRSKSFVSNFAIKNILKC